MSLYCFNILVTQGTLAKSFVSFKGSSPEACLIDVFVLRPSLPLQSSIIHTLYNKLLLNMRRKCTRCETVELLLASRVDNQRNELGRWVYSYIRVHRNNCFKSKLIAQNSMKTCNFKMDSSTAISAPKFVYYIKYYFTCTFCHLIYCKYHPLFILLEDL